MRAGINFDDNTSPIPISNLSTGLHLHSAPGINTPKLEITFDSTDIFSQIVEDAQLSTLWKPGYRIPWATDNVQVYIRPIHALQLGNQVWYSVEFVQITDGTFDFTYQVYDPADPNGILPWVLGEYDTQQYITTPPPSPSPCAGLPTPTEVTFYYDREAAAEYARVQGRYHAQGNTPPGPGNVKDGPQAGQNRYYDVFTGETVGFVTNDLRQAGLGSTYFPYAQFAYLSGNIISGTSSARFTSEILWMGGYPMGVTKNNGACNNSNFDILNWFYCPLGSGGIASGGFRQHLNARRNSGNGGVLAYVGAYDEVNQYGVMGAYDLFPTDGIIRNPNLPYRYLQNTYTTDAGDRRLDKNGNILGDVKTGDYFIIYSASDAPGDWHGTIVTGWGRVQNCSDAIQAERNGSLTLYKTDQTTIVDPLDPSANEYYVPYISDFSEWINSDGELLRGTDPDTGAQITVSSDNRQTPASGPFYCVIYTSPQNNDINSNFAFGSGDGASDIQFIRIPDIYLVNVSQLEEYHEDTGVWGWNATQIPTFTYQP